MFTVKVKLANSYSKMNQIDQPVEVGDGTLGWPGMGTVGTFCFSPTIGDPGSPGMRTLGSLFCVGDPTGVSTSLIVSSI